MTGPRSSSAPSVIGLPQIAEDIGVTRDNFDGFVSNLVEGFDRIATKGKDYQAIQENIGAGVKVLADNVEGLGPVANATFINMVKLAKETGGEIQEIEDIINEGLSKAVSGFDRLIGDLEGGLGQARFDRLGTILADISTGLISQGGDIKELLPSIDKLIEKQKELGLEGSEAFRKIVAERNFLKDNETILTGLGGLKDIIDGIGVSTFLSTEGFRALQGEVANSFNQLVEGEGSRERALQASAGALQGLVNQSIARGEALDVTTQGLVNEAAAMGLVEVAGTGLTSSLETGFNRVIAAITGMSIEEAAAFGQLEVDATAAAETVEVEMTDAANATRFAWSLSTAEIVASLQSIGGGAALTAGEIEALNGRIATAIGQEAETVQALIEELAAAAGQSVAEIQAKLNSLSAPELKLVLRTEVAGDVPIVAPTLEVPGRQHGGPVEAGRPYVVGEAGPEVIVPSSGGTVIPLGGDGAGETSAEMTINLVQRDTDGRVLSVDRVRAKLAPGLQRLLDNRELTVPRDGVRDEL